ncbi:hypothetical protein MKX79_04180 [Viridibacillus sp. FSL R5-0468]
MGFKVKMTPEESKRIMQGMIEQGKKYGLPGSKKKQKTIKK